MNGGLERTVWKLLAGIKTLIVEDSMPTRRMLRARLETLGCTIVGEAENATQGLKLFRDLAPQIVTLDLVMPTARRSQYRGLVQNYPRGKSRHQRHRHQFDSKAITAINYLSQGAIAYLEKPLSTSINCARNSTPCFRI